jgi:hypothetical protein
MRRLADAGTEAVPPGIYIVNANGEPIALSGVKQPLHEPRHAVRCLDEGAKRRGLGDGCGNEVAGGLERSVLLVSQLFHLLSRTDFLFRRGGGGPRAWGAAWARRSKARGPRGVKQLSDSQSVHGVQPVRYSRLHSMTSLAAPAESRSRGVASPLRVRTILRDADPGVRWHRGSALL